MSTKYTALIACFIAGAAGALIKDIVKDNALIMPKKENGKLYLGFIGAMIIGGVIGYLIDHSIITAFSTSYMGMATIDNIIGGKIEQTKTIEEEIQKKIEPTKEEITNLIEKIAKETGIDPKLAIRVAKCESGLNPKARLVNSPNSIDRGLFQINSYYHKEVTDEQADDPEFATKWFCNAVKNGHLDWWKASKKCWKI